MITCMMKDGQVSLMCEGSLLDITSETVALVREIYTRLKDDNEGAADCYKQVVRGAAEDGIMFDKDPLESIKSIIEKLEEKLEDDAPDPDSEDFTTRALRELGGATEE